MRKQKDRLVSEFTRPEDAQRARAAGADVYLLTCLPEDFLAHIARRHETRGDSA